jgi:hypothetical protein
MGLLHHGKKKIQARESIILVCNIVHAAYVTVIVAKPSSVQTP